MAAADAARRAGQSSLHEPAVGRQARGLAAAAASPRGGACRSERTRRGVEYPRAGRVFVDGVAGARGAAAAAERRGGGGRAGAGLRGGNALAADGPREEDGELQEDGAGGEGTDELDGFW